MIQSREYKDILLYYRKCVMNLNGISISSIIFVRHNLKKKDKNCILFLNFYLVVYNNIVKTILRKGLLKFIIIFSIDTEDYLIEILIILIQLSILLNHLYCHFKLLWLLAIILILLIKYLLTLMLLISVKLWLIHLNYYILNIIL